MGFSKIAMGGGCHWCTEAVFLSLKGVHNVEQGFVASKDLEKSFSEAVVVTYDDSMISMKDLIAVHLHTHKSTSDHSFRQKYRSAVYVYSKTDYHDAVEILDALATDFKDKLITKVHYFDKFKPSEQHFQDYYYTNPQKPFCETYISPKLKTILTKFGKLADQEKINVSREAI